VKKREIGNDSTRDKMGNCDSWGKKKSNVKRDGEESLMRSPKRKNKLAKKAQKG